MRSAAILELARQGDDRTCGRLVKLLQSDADKDVRRFAAYALGNIRGPRAVAALRDAFRRRGETPAVRAEAAEQLATSFTWEAVPDLIQGLRDESAEVRFWCAYGLGFLRVEAAVPELKRLAAKDRGRVPRWWSIAREARWAISEIGRGPWESRSC